MKFFSVIFGGLVLGLGFIATLILISLWKAWAVAILWAWFVTPIFSLPAIGYWQAAGLVLFVSTLRANTITKGSNAHAFNSIILGPPVAVAFGWLIKVVSGM